MPVNLELKAPLPSLQKARDSVLACGAEFRGVLVQEDMYFNVQKGRLKIREMSGGVAELIYYERAEDTPERWCTYFKEQVVNAEPVKHLLARALGVLVIVRKHRNLFLFGGDVRIHLDQVDGLGLFVEFEIPGDNVARSQGVMKRLREVFDIRDEAVIKESYSDMILAKRISPEA